MRSPKKGRAPSGLESVGRLRTIHCLRCEKEKSGEGARSFKAFKVCAECCQFLDSLPVAAKDAVSR